MIFLGITEIGWILFALIWLPFASLILIFLSRSFNLEKLWKGFVLVVAGFLLCALPVVDAAWSAWWLKEKCPESGLEILDRVTVDGYFDEELTSSYLKGSGYRFREYPAPFNRGYLRAELKEDGTVAVRKIDHPTARYRSTKWVSAEISYGVSRSEKRIFDSLLSKDIAKDVVVSSYPGFLDRLWLRWFGPIQALETCHREGQKSVTTEITKILIPINKDK